MHGLLETDEETDSATYAAYLRAQTDGDLLDILQHTDPERYPARVDAVRRETQRRSVMPVTLHTTEERFMRGLCVVAFAFSAILGLLTVLLTADDAAGPRWVDLDNVPAGTPASELVRQEILGILRALTVGGLQMAIPSLLLLTLGGWLIYRAANRTTRGDVKRLALVGIGLLCAALLLAAAPFSHVPDLASLPASGSGFWARLQTLLMPW